MLLDAHFTGARPRSSAIPDRVDRAARGRQVDFGQPAGATISKSHSLNWTPRSSGISASRSERFSPFRANLHIAGPSAAPSTPSSTVIRNLCWRPAAALWPKRKLMTSCSSRCFTVWVKASPEEHMSRVSRKGTSARCPRTRKQWPISNASSPPARRSMQEPMPSSILPGATSRSQLLGSVASCRRGAVSGAQQLLPQLPAP